MGSVQLRRAPRELLPGRVQVRLRRAQEPGRASQKRTLLGARQETHALNQLFYSLWAPCATQPSRPARRIRPLAAKTCGQEGRELPRWAPAGREPSPLAVGAESPKALGRASLQRPVCGAASLRGASACCSLPEHPQTPRHPELAKPPTPQRWRKRLLRLRAPGSSRWCENLEPQVNEVDPHLKASFPQCPAARGLGPLPA